MPNAPRNAPPGRLSSGMLAEAVERDLGASDSQTTTSRFVQSDPGTLTVEHDGTSIFSVTQLNLVGMFVVTEVSAGVVEIVSALPIQTLELTAQSAGADERVRQSIVPYDVSWADEYRYVAYQSNIHGAVLQARYYDGSAWQNVGTSFTTGAAAALSYVSAWQTIPAAWKSVGDAFCQVAATNEPDTHCDMPYVALQFRQSCSRTTTISNIPSCGTATVVTSGTISESGLAEFGETPLDVIAPPLP